MTAGQEPAEEESAMVSPATPRASTSRHTSTLRWVSAVSVIAGVVLGSSACGSPSASPSSSAAGTAATAAGGSGSPSQASAGGALSRLGSELASGQSQTFLAHYKFKSLDEAGTLTIGHAGSNTLFAATVPQGSFEEIAGATRSTLCGRQSGPWMCFSGPLASTIRRSVSPLTGNFSPRALLAKLNGYRASAYDVTTSTKTVAGRSVNCVTFHTHKKAGIFTVCATSSGILAEAVGSDISGRYSLVLSSISSSVPASTFTPPAKLSGA